MLIVPEFVLKSLDQAGGPLDTSKHLLPLYQMAAVVLPFAKYWLVDFDDFPWASGRNTPLLNLVEGHLAVQVFHLKKQQKSHLFPTTTATFRRLCRSRRFFHRTFLARIAIMFVFLEHHHSHIVSRKPHTSCNPLKCQCKAAYMYYRFNLVCLNEI